MTREPIEQQNVQKNNADLRTQSLDLLRFPLALVILTLHVFPAEKFRVRGIEYSFEKMPVFQEVNHFFDWIS